LFSAPPISQTGSSRSTGSSPSTAVAIALGSNLGDRHAHLLSAADALRGIVSDVRVSAFIETEPVGVGDQPTFLNAALVGETRLDARPLLNRLLAIERQLGRTRPFERAPRTIDLDLIFYGAYVIDEPGLYVPHPRFRERRFVLEPLAALAPAMVDPVTGLTIAELLLDLVSRTES
jgi:2-amino-4-hydroxy-6-hydroxymethyldihydropteridine diphosphokinase